MAVLSPRVYVIVQSLNRLTENPIAATADSLSIHNCTIRLCGRRRKRSRIAFYHPPPLLRPAYRLMHHILKRFPHQTKCKLTAFSANSANLISPQRNNAEISSDGSNNTGALTYQYQVRHFVILQCIRIFKDVTCLLLILVCFFFIQNLLLQVDHVTFKERFVCL